MANASPPSQRPKAYVKPQPRLARSIGILTILYSLGLIVYGLINFAVVYGLPYLDGALSEVQKEQVESQTKRRQQALEVLDERMAKAATPAAKAQVTLDRLLLEQTEPAGIPGMTVGLGMFSDPKVQSGSAIDTGIKLALNVLLLFAGIGLMRSKPWGRSLGLVASWLKIPVLVVLTVVAIRYGTPLLAEAFTKDMGKMMGQAFGGSEPPANLAAEWAGYSAMMSKSFSTIIALFAAFGLLYPILLIVMLNRPTLRAELGKKPSV